MGIFYLVLNGAWILGIILCIKENEWEPWRKIMVPICFIVAGILGVFAALFDGNRFFGH